MPVVIEDMGMGNQVLGSPTADSNVTLRFGGSNNVIEFGSNVRLTGHETLERSLIFCRGHGQRVLIAGDNRLSASIYLSGRGSRVVIGRGTRCNAPIWMNAGEPGDAVEIGEDCLLANVRFRTSDSHPLFDGETGERINHSAPIRIGNNVWIAEDVLILKGAEVGDGAVIGARALVTRPIPPRCLAVGVPARVIRENVRWAEKL